MACRRLDRAVRNGAGKKIREVISEAKSGEIEWCQAAQPVPMQVVDTFVLVAFRDRNYLAFKKANEYVIEISLRHDILVPSTTLMEFDLELKSHGEGGESSAEIHQTVARLIPRSRGPAPDPRRAETGSRAVQGRHVEGFLLLR